MSTPNIDPVTPQAIDLGLYVHLPFCASRCAYCTFVVTTSRDLLDPYMKALESEIEMIGLPRGVELNTLYFGGGTPSQVPLPAFSSLAARIAASNPIQAETEFTAEANPEDVSDELLAAWASAGVNRISIGVQSFVPGELAALDRRHDAAKAVEAARRIQETGAFKLSIDLMLAIPHQDLATLERSLDTLLEIRPHHVSVYLLEMDKPHRLQAYARRYPEQLADEEQAAALYLEVHHRLAGAGYEHYEISNFALPGMAARHNTRYWERRRVEALGVAAHGIDGDRRWANLDNLQGYLLAVERGTRPLAWSNALNGREVLAEDVMLGLRLARGVATPRVAEARSEFRGFGNRLDEFLGLDLAEELDGRTRLTPSGWLLSNELFVELV